MMPSTKAQCSQRQWPQRQSLHLLQLRAGVVVKGATGAKCQCQGSNSSVYACNQLLVQHICYIAAGSNMHKEHRPGVCHMIRGRHTMEPASCLHYFNLQPNIRQRMPHTAPVEMQ